MLLARKSISYGLEIYLGQKHFFSDPIFPLSVVHIAEACCALLQHSYKNYSEVLLACRIAD